MEDRKKLSKRRNDAILIAVILIAGIAVLLLDTGLRQPGARVRVVLGNEVYGVYDLNSDREIAIDKDGRYNDIVISNGSVKMKAANCPGGDCVRQKAINMTGQAIVCLPNRIFITIEGAESGETDSVAY